jgi:hypothetical protein
MYTTKPGGIMKKVSLVILMFVGIVSAQTFIRDTIIAGDPKAKVSIVNNGKDTITIDSIFVIPMTRDTIPNGYSFMNFNVLSNNITTRYELSYLDTIKGLFFFTEYLKSKIITIAPGDTTVLSSIRAGDTGGKGMVGPSLSLVYSRLIFKSKAVSDTLTIMGKFAYLTEAIKTTPRVPKTITRTKSIQSTFNPLGKKISAKNTHNLPKGFYIVR